MSKLIKANHYFSLDDIKLIESARQQQLAAEQSNEPPGLTEEEEQELADAHAMKEQILRDAETFAEEQVRMAMEQTAAAQQQAQEEIDRWWQEQRQKDATAAEEAAQRGFEEGYRQGQEAAQLAVRQEYDGMLQEASSVLTQAHQEKQRIILEAEPFLIELSCAIAEKIIQKQLTVEPTWITDLARSVLSRRRERGLITLCVAPQHYALFQDAKEELMLAVDSQAELQILPDGTVSDQGCVIRSAFGSIDARIDTQLKEVKSALQHLAMTEEEAVEE